MAPALPGTLARLAHGAASLAGRVASLLRRPPHWSDAIPTPERRLSPALYAWARSQRDLTTAITACDHLPHLAYLVALFGKVPGAESLSPEEARLRMLRAAGFCLRAALMHLPAGESRARDVLAGILTTTDQHVTAGLRTLGSLDTKLHTGQVIGLLKDHADVLPTPPGDGDGSQDPSVAISLELGVLSLLAAARMLGASCTETPPAWHGLAHELEHAVHIALFTGWLAHGGPSPLPRLGDTRRSRQELHEALARVMNEAGGPSLEALQVKVWQELLRPQAAPPVSTGTTLPS